MKIIIELLIALLSWAWYDSLVCKHIENKSYAWHETFDVEVYWKSVKGFERDLVDM